MTTKLLKIIFSVFALWFFLAKTVASHSSVVVIKMTSNSFEPAQITLDQNASIIFVNEDTLPRWPASNIHPTHELYPEFDPKKPIDPGESWSFKPQKPGVWKYHDHLSPHIRGSLTVTTEGSTSKNFLESIKIFFVNLYQKILSILNHTPKAGVNPETFKELSPEEQFKTLTNFAKKEGAQKAWSRLLEIYKGEAGSTGNIHDLAHLTGKLIYEDKGISGISICTPTFAFGCYHGLLDTAFKTSLAGLPIAEKECEKIGLVNSGPYGSCVHGIGHGVASFHQTQDLKAALTSCDGLIQGRNFCYDGVLMEFIRGAPSSFYSKTDPFYPCSNLEKESGTLYSIACGRNQPTVFIQKLGLKFESAVVLCGENALSDKFKNSCFEAVGFMLASIQDVQKIISGCKSIKNSNYSFLCLKSAAGELIFQESPSWQEKSRQVCDALMGSLRTLCHENLQRLIKEYGRGGSKFNLLQKGQNKDSYARDQMRICYEAGGRDDCYRQVADIFSSQFGLGEILSIFAKNETSPEIYSRCHEVTHYLSRSAFERSKSIGEVYSQCDSTCHGGCYHGTLEAYLKEKNLEGEELTKHFPAVCGRQDDFESPLVFNECLHGLGHAAMYVKDMDVPGSLALCDALSESNYQERCYSGVFMENSSSSTNIDHPGKYVKAEDPFFPCNWLGEKYSKICYRYQSSYFALISNHDWNKVASLCMSVPQNYQDDCFRTIGTNQVGFTQDVDKMKENCNLMPTDHFKEVCTQGIVSSFAYRFVGDDARIAKFCLEVVTTNREACFRQMGTAIVDWSKKISDATAICSKIENDDYSSWCKASIP